MTKTNAATTKGPAAPVVSPLENMLRTFKAALKKSSGDVDRRYKDAIETLFISNADLGGSVAIRDESARVISQEGVSLGSLSALQNALDLQVLESYNLVSLEKSQASRLRSGARPLNEFQSARTLRAMELAALSTEVFGTKEQAAIWLKRPHAMFEGEAPLSYAVSEFGASKVRNALVAIRYGGVV